MGLIKWWRRLKIRRYVKGLKVIPPQRLAEDVDHLALTQLVQLPQRPSTRLSVPVPPHVPIPARDLERTKRVALPITRRDIPLAPEGPPKEALPEEGDGLGLLDQFTMAAPLGYTDFAAESGTHVLPSEPVDPAPDPAPHVDHHCDPAHSISDQTCDPVNGPDSDGGSTNNE